MRKRTSSIKPFAMGSWDLAETISLVILKCNPSKYTRNHCSTCWLLQESIVLPLIHSPKGCDESLDLAVLIPRD